MSSKRIRWPQHCLNGCPYLTSAGGDGLGVKIRNENQRGMLVCGYCLYTGKSLIKEYGHIGAQAIRDCCRHYSDDFQKTCALSTNATYRGCHSAEELDRAKKRHNEKGLADREARKAKIKSLYESGKNDTEIARELGIKTYRVKAWRDENNLPSNAPNSVRYSHLTLEERTQLRREKAAAYHRKRYAERRAENPALSARDEQIRERNESIMRLYEQGMNDREIARALGKSDKTICAWRARRNLPTNYDPRAKRGVRNHEQ